MVCYNRVGHPKTEPYCLKRKTLTSGRGGPCDITVKKEGKSGWRKRRRGPGRLSHSLTVLKGVVLLLEGKGALQDGAKLRHPVT